MEPKDSQESSLDPQIKETFERIEQIVAKLPRDSVQKVTLLKGGGMDITFLSEIMSAQKSINLSDFKEDDVIWWKTKNGGRYYHIIKGIYKVDGNANIAKEGYGPFKGVTSSNEIIEEEKVGIHGASYGGSIRLFHINEGVPVETIIFSKNPSKHNETFITSAVDSMGVIKAEQYKNT